MLYTILQPALILCLNIILSDAIPYRDLRSILSKKNTINWLDSFNNSDVSPNPYCRICCITIKSETIGKQCGWHTLCKYKQNEVGRKCRGYIKIHFTKSERDALLDAHNTLRNYVASGQERRGNPGPQPSASNMRALQWSEELALVADRWISQCIYSNDICRDLDRFPVGQNIVRGNFATNDLLSFIKEWYDEVLYFNAIEVDSFHLPDGNSSLFTKYTQMMWADTYQIGCARAAFQTPIGSKVSYVEHFFCNYGPSGNIPNQPVYLKGPACTACPEGTSCTLEYPALCEVDIAIELEKAASGIMVRKQSLKSRVKYHNTGASSVKPPLRSYAYIFLLYWTFL
ncbi:hypothetical protein PPYR_05040 [Photinus pyralis]|uniref:SCP domain-containing protein n=3 Tax=Photinus pyralis TaxID=7054 RepID=A0A5N4AZU6_PHOPY|nr:venom allergen 5-like [Photinus pyralis]XP_031334277.1 venom allergen 5-like [Photinus pyralis]XP_031334403.1 venom allergen 5-like [Photinus pyralis]XP_031334404.1 venom allergen 5-like [Photinus pyralis]KAB0802852.1 hypothetical protein PPYR_05038 [Photinus pyralis]KAB0802854.1 hypothetical protein PPYR_05040 [Photinus pyralis]